MKEYEKHASGNRMADDASLSLSNVIPSLKAFFSLITDGESLPDFAFVINADIKRSIHLKMCLELVEAYEHVYHALKTEENGYKTNTAHIEHSPDDIRTIFSIK